MRPAPMLATDGALPSAAGWIAEPKMDGWRAIVCVENGRVTVWSRHGTNLTDRFPELEALTVLGDAVLDGELVVYGADGLPDFHALAGGPSRRRACLATFDLLRLDGESLVSLPYEQRRERLEGLDLPACAEPVATGPVDVMWEATAGLGMEGVVAKRLDSTYRRGRSRAWIRAKHWRVSTLHVRGYTTTPLGGLAALFVTAGDGTGTAKVELGLGRFAAGALDDALRAVAGQRERDVVWVDPVITVSVRHHGPVHQPRDATFVSLG